MEKASPVNDVMLVSGGDKAGPLEKEPIMGEQCL